MAPPVLTDRSKAYLPAVLGLILMASAGGLWAQSPAPDFALPSLGGPTVGLSDLAGKPAILLFGSTHCPHCQDVLPLLAELQEEYADRLGVVFIAVRQPFQQVLEEYFGRHMTYEVLVDVDGLVSSRYGIRAVPTCIGIDAEGRLVYRGRLSRMLAAALVEGNAQVLQDAREPDSTRTPRPTDRLRRSAGKWQLPQRFIVELDESPKAVRKATAAVKQRRRRELRRAAEKIDARIVHNYGRWKNRIVLEIPPDRLGLLTTLPGFKSARPDPKVHALIADTAGQIRADYAWDNAVSGQGAKVCVVDTGVDWSHPDLLNKVVAQYDFFEDDDDAMDDNGHGTHVAGIIASQGITYRGISYDADLLAAKVLGANGDGYASDVALGVQWCVEQGADVINLSLGEGLYDKTCDGTEMAQAVNEAVDAGAVVVCASGNDGNPNEIVSPACASKAIAVGSVDKLDGIASYSDGGKELDLVAPGGDQLGGDHYPEIVSTYSTLVAQDPDLCMYDLAEMCYDNWFVVDGDRYIRAVGTSMAAPHVAAAAALLLEANPHLSPVQLKELMQSTAVDLGPAGWDNVYGWGRIDLEKALDNLPAAVGELTLDITDPNAPPLLFEGQVFNLAAAVDCLGGDGCGEVSLQTEIGDPNGRTFIPLAFDTALATDDPNPVDLGALSGITLETEAPARFDVEIVHDLTDQTFVKVPSPEGAIIGSDLALHYTSPDLEPEDGIGASGEDAQKIYEFTIPAGEPNRLLVQMEHFFVFQWDDPPAGWRVELCTADGTVLGLVGECIPPSGGGGEPPSPDCWFTTSDAAVLSALNPGGVNYLRLSSFGVDGDDHLAFNNIYVHVEYEIDPAYDDVHRYYLQFDLSGIDTSYEITAARLSLTVLDPAETSIAEIHLTDPNLEPGADARRFYNVTVPPYSTLLNPIKTFGCDRAATLSVNLRAAVVEAVDAGYDRLALSIQERGEDCKPRLAGLAGDMPPQLIISQTVPPDMAPGDPDGGEPNPAPGPLPVFYDTHLQRDVSAGTYARIDTPDAAVVGSTMATEYSTGDLETEDGIGAVGEDAEKVYAFELPLGDPEEIRIRMEHYVVLQFDDPPSRWQIYTCDPNGNEWHLIDECTPVSGGGGEPPPPDCWFISTDPAVLADLQPGGTNYIKIRSVDVGEFDMLSFSTLELIARYPLDPDNDTIHRYYLQFDLSGLPADAAVDTAVLNLNVVDAAENAVGQVLLVENTYGPDTGAYTIYHASDAPYSNLINPVKTFGAEQAGVRHIQLRPAVEDALQSPARRLALLITEHDENALFTLAGSTSSTPPTLDIYLHGGVTSGRASWTVQAKSAGRFRLRVSATSSLGPVVTDEVLVTVTDPNRPVIDDIQCHIDGQWDDCRRAQYGQSIDAVRVAARDLQQVPYVHVNLRNVPDDVTWIDTDAAWDGEFFMVSDANLVVEDSGQWIIRVVADDDDGNTDEKSLAWDIPWGRMQARHMAPVGPVDIPKGTAFDIVTEIECIEAECADVRAWIGVNEPVETRYDDGSAEDYGEIGASGAYVAARITPQTYPARLQTARFFIYDETAYPFELHVWAANGPTDPSNPSVRMPGTELITPFVVYPVVTGTHDVRWFDVDLADHNIALDSGDLYIGWQQLEDTRNNQVGFDTDGPAEKRTWAYLGLLGWFNLDDFCSPEWPDFCGNIMIRAVFGDPAYYRGQVPTQPAIAPVYVADEHPQSLGNLKAGQMRQTMFTVYVTGPVDDHARIRAAAVSGHSVARTDPFDVTIIEPRNNFEAANLDARGPVDLGDLSLLAAGWLDDEPPLFADASADGHIDLEDLALLAQSWLKTAAD